jgi:lipopolysaccharide export system protein LptA
MQRFARIAGSFAIVLVAYWIYAHTAVPLIEPSAKAAGEDLGEKEPRSRLKASDDFYLKELQGLFRPGAWEIDPKKPPKILEVNNRAKLLLQDYETQADGRIKLTPCTMVFLHDGPAESEEERLRQAIVLEAPEGAIVKFDAPLDAKLLKFGRPIGGELPGNITIRSGGKSPGPEDDLLIHAHGLTWNGLDAYSDYPVEFRWGKNFGSGSGLHIKLAPRDSDSIADENGPNVSRIELFEMRKIDRLHIEGNPNDFPRAVAANPAATGASVPDRNPLATAAEGGPIEITCAGPFRFNLPKRVASFENRVEVKQRNRSGPDNQLLCDKVSLYFVPRGAGHVAADASPSDLEPERIEAEGKPVTLSAPSALPEKCAYARGEHLSYNLKTNLVELDGGLEVELIQGKNEIHGKSLKYLPNPSKAPNALGRAWVMGPGRLNATADKRPDQHLEAHWNGELNLSPKDGCHVISLTGGASLDFTGFGNLSAESIFFWIEENPHADQPQQPPYKPVKMLARKNVALDLAAKSKSSAEPIQITGALDEMKVWFEQKGAPNGIRVETNDRTKNGEGGTGKARGGTGNEETGPNLGNPATGGKTGQGASAPGNRFRRAVVTVSYPILQPRTAYRQPVPDSPQAFSTRQPPAIVRPMDAASANPQPTSNGNRGLMTNPYIPGRANVNNLPLPSKEGRGEGIGAGPASGRRQRFALRGEIMEAKVLLQEDMQAQPEFSNLVITGNVLLEETQSREPGEKPLVIAGDKVVAVNLGTSDAAVENTITVLGRPASVEGHGMRMNGTNINLDRRANRLWIDGPGDMELPMPDDFNGHPLPAPGKLNVKWKKGMSFDGLYATFEEEVDAVSPAQHLHTQTLRVKLQQPIDFSDPQLQNQKGHKAAFLSCSGGVFLESDSVNEKQSRTYIRMEAADLDFDLLSGALTAGGPGWLNSVRPDDANLLQNQQGIFLPIRAAAPPSGSPVSPVVQPQPTAPLMAMQVRFQGAITGNLNPAHQRIIFNDRVRLLCAPASDWSFMLNPDKTEPLGPNEFMLKCDNLEVRNAVHPVTKANSTEMDAQGNSVVYGVRSTPKEKDVMYTARAMRISYNTAKDQLILEGDGRTDVHLYRQLQLGAPWDDTAMKKIIFYIKSNTVSTEGIQSLQINRLAPLGK